MSVLAAIAVLSLIVVHELGHFIAARSRVSRQPLSLGFGPTLFKYQGTERVCCAGIPLGGYVGFPDDDLIARFLSMILIS